MIFLGSEILVMKLEGLNWMLVRLIILNPFKWLMVKEWILDDIQIWWRIYGCGVK